MKVKISTNFVNELMVLPKYAHKGDAGLDLQANIVKAIAVGPASVLKVPTGISVALPKAATSEYRWVFDVRPRSGLAANSTVGVLNAPGTIDQDYRGEIQVLLYNGGDNVFLVKPGMRIAQLVLSRAFSVVWEEVQSLDETARNTSGFGSTGV